MTTRRIVIALAALLTACVGLPIPDPGPDPANPWGRFVGRVVAIWNDDGRTMTLAEPYRYIGPDGAAWHAPAGAVVDGASIPQIAWSVIGGPFEGVYRNASVIHDVACDDRSASWQDTHIAFYTAMRASKVEEGLAKQMYAAVYFNGPRWPSERELGATPPPVFYAAADERLTPGDFSELRAEILARNLSIEEIRAFRPARRQHRL